MLKPTPVVRFVKGSGDSSFQSMKEKLLHLSKSNNKKFLNGTSSRHSSVVKNAQYPKDTITGVYHHPSLDVKSKKSSNASDFEKIPKSMSKRYHELKNKKLATTTDFATSNLTKGSKSEFDSIIKHWIKTNWMDSKPVIQRTPCHLFVHDKLLCEDLSLFKIVQNLIVKEFPELANIPYEVIEKSWKDELNKVSFQTNQNMSKLQKEKILRNLIKTVYVPFANVSGTVKEKLNKFTNDSYLIRRIITGLGFNVNINEEIFSKLKNVENLNERNDITIIKDNELNLIPSLDYMCLMNELNNKHKNPIKDISILKSKNLLGDKTTDMKSLQSLKGLLLSKKLHCNEKFIILTRERSISLEYYRLLKLFNKVYTGLNRKGCVVYLNGEDARKNREILDNVKHTGKELYYVIEDFSEIYDIIEVL